VAAVKADLSGLLIGFTVGLAGLLIVASAGRGDLVWVAMFFLGALAAVGSQRWSGLLGLVVGILAFYPIALELGVIAFLGDASEVAVALGVAIAAAGFVALRVLRRSIEAGRSLPHHPSK
jgi:hypothetical protein